MRIADQTLQGLASILLGDGTIYYRSRADLVAFFNELGWNDTSEEHIQGPGLSRYTYVCQHFRAVNGSPQMDKVILQLADPRFYLRKGGEVQPAVNQINALLLVDGYVLASQGLGYVIRPYHAANTTPGKDSPTDDEFLASAVRYLIDGGEDDAAQILLACVLHIADCGCLDVVTETNWHMGMHQVFDVLLRGPRSAHDVLVDATHPITQSVQAALKAVLPAPTHPPYIRNFRVQAEITAIDPDWRAALLEIARGRGVSNQLGSPGNGMTRIWNNLRFRSQSEVRIAEALDRAGVLFLPNCLARLTAPDGRKNREADFLVCHHGKWGILEVDGEPFHPPSRTVHDHERDRLFKHHGIRVIEHFDANECYERPDETVAKFLAILEQL